MKQLALFALALTIFIVHYARAHEIDKRTSAITKVTIETLPNNEKEEKEAENQQKNALKGPKRGRRCLRGRCRKRKIYTRLEDIEKELEIREQEEELDRLEREIERRERKEAEKKAPELPRFIHQVIITIK